MSKSRVLIDGKTYVPLETAKLRATKPVETLSEKVKRLRTERGLSGAQLADLVGTSYQRINQIENGISPDLKISMVRSLCLALNVSPEELIFTKEEK